MMVLGKKSHKLSLNPKLKKPTPFGKILFKLLEFKSWLWGNAPASDSHITKISWPPGHKCSICFIPPRSHILCWWCLLAWLCYCFTIIFNFLGSHILFYYYALVFPCFYCISSCMLFLSHCSNRLYIHLKNFLKSISIFCWYVQLIFICCYTFAHKSVVALAISLVSTSFSNIYCS